MGPWQQPTGRQRSQMEGSTLPAGESQPLRGLWQHDKPAGTGQQQVFVSSIRCLLSLAASAHELAGRPHLDELTLLYALRPSLWRQCRAGSLAKPTRQPAAANMQRMHDLNPVRVSHMVLR